jgi:hypothetical protein
MKKLEKIDNHIKRLDYLYKNNEASIHNKYLLEVEKKNKKAIMKHKYL